MVDWKTAIVLSCPQKINCVSRLVDISLAKTLIHLDSVQSLHTHKYEQLALLLLLCIMSDKFPYLEIQPFTIFHGKVSPARKGTMDSFPQRICVGT